MAKRYSCPSCGRWFEFEAADSETFADKMDCPLCFEGEARAVKNCACGKTGTYKYSKKLNRLIKISDAVPGLCGEGCNCGGECSSCGGGCSCGN